MTMVAVGLGLQTLVGYLWGTTIPVTVSTAEFWPKSPTGFDYVSNASATYVSGGFDHAIVQVAGISLIPRLVFAFATGLLTFVVVAITMFVRRLTKTIESGSSLSQALALNASITGWVVLAAGLLSSIANLVGNNLAQTELFGSQRSFGWDISHVFQNPWAQGENLNYGKVFGFLMPSPQYVVELWPVVIALALLLVSKILRRANKLELDVDGLV